MKKERFSFFSLLYLPHPFLPKQMQFIAFRLGLCNLKAQKSQTGIESSLNTSKKNMICNLIFSKTSHD